MPEKWALWIFPHPYYTLTFVNPLYCLYIHSRRLMQKLYSASPVMFKNNPLGFIICLLLIPVFGLGLLILVFWYLGNKATKISITDSDVLLERGLLSKERSEVNIKSIRTTKVTQSFFSRMFGVGAIEIYTAGDTAEIVASGIPNPNKIRDIIKQQQSV